MATVTLRQSLSAMSSALDAASADLDLLALMAVDEPHAVELAAAAIFHALANLMNREAAHVRAA